MKWTSASGTPTMAVIGPLRASIWVSRNGIAYSVYYTDGIETVRVCTADGFDSLAEAKRSAQQAMREAFAKWLSEASQGDEA